MSLLFEIILAVLAVFGAVCLLRMLTDDWCRRCDTVTSLIYDGSFAAEELGCIVCQTRRGFCRVGRVTVTVLPGVELDGHVAEALVRDGVEIYYVSERLCQ